MAGMTRSFSMLPLLAALAFAGCMGDNFNPGSGTHEAVPDAGTFPVGRTGGPTVLVGNWNLDWFGYSISGAPADKDLQQANVTAVLRDAGADIWGLVEVVDDDRLARVVSDLGNYGYLVADDTTKVIQPQPCTGTKYPCYEPGEQMPALVYRTDLVAVQRAQLILSEAGSDFAGRPPMRVDIRVRQNDVISDLTLIVLHMKAQSGTTDPASYNRRAAASSDLKAYMDANLAGQKVLVLGDWNDDVDESINADSSGVYSPSPYANFVGDPAHWDFPTAELSDAGYHSTTDYPGMIDHQLDSAELFGLYVPHSATLVRPDLWVGAPYYGTSTYQSTTTDHYPVMAEYQLGIPDAGYLYDGGM